MPSDTQDGMPPPASTQAAEDAAYQAIASAILAGRMRPGMPLRERTLAELFGITRAGVRKVLARLERDGMAELHHNRGAFVPAPTAEDIHAVYDARRALEMGMLMLLASKIGETECRALMAHVAEEEAAHACGDRERAVHLAGAFHATLARMVGNAELDAFLQRLVARTRLFVALYEPHASGGCAADEHRAIVQALADGDATAAMHAMRTHLDDIETRVTRRRHHEAPPSLRDIFGA